MRKYPQKDFRHIGSASECTRLGRARTRTPNLQHRHRGKNHVGSEKDSNWISNLGAAAMYIDEGVRSLLVFLLISSTSIRTRHWHLPCYCNASHGNVRRVKPNRLVALPFPGRPHKSRRSEYGAVQYHWGSFYVIDQWWSSLSFSCLGGHGNVIWVIYRKVRVVFVLARCAARGHSFLSSRR